MSANDTHCIQCQRIYKPDPNLDSTEYWNCSSCNAKEVREIVKLQNIRISADGFKTKPGKHNGRKSVINKEIRSKKYADNF